MPLANSSPEAMGSSGAARKAARSLGRLIPPSFVLSAMDHGSTKALERLLSWGYPVERPIRGEQRVLHHAVFSRGPAEARIAIAAGADVNAPGHAGLTALAQALWQSRMDIIQELLAAGADPNKREPDGATPLHRALLKFPEAVGPLLRAGADPGALGPLMKESLAEGLPFDIALAIIHEGRSLAGALSQAPLIAAAKERLELSGDSELSAKGPARAQRARL